MRKTLTINLWRGHTHIGVHKHPLTQTRVHLQKICSAHRYMPIYKPIYRRRHEKPIFLY